MYCYETPSSPAHPQAKLVKYITLDTQFGISNIGYKYITLSCEVPSQSSHVGV